MTERLRDCEPAPHDLVHADHAPNADTTQCSAHACSLHERTWRTCGHSTPPNVTAVMMERERDCAPVPHDLVHVDQAPKADVAQWIGHGPWLHGCVSAVWLQALPPFEGAVVERLRFCEPPPHDLVHVDQAFQPWVTQLPAHGKELHARVSL